MIPAVKPAKAALIKPDPLLGGRGDFCESCDQLVPLLVRQRLQHTAAMVVLRLHDVRRMMDTMIGQAQMHEAPVVCDPLSRKKGVPDQPVDKGRRGCRDNTQMPAEFACGRGRMVREELNGLQGEVIEPEGGILGSLFGDPEPAHEAADPLTQGIYLVAWDVFHDRKLHPWKSAGEFQQAAAKRSWAKHRQNEHLFGYGKCGLKGWNVEREDHFSVFQKQREATAPRAAHLTCCLQH